MTEDPGPKTLARDAKQFFKEYIFGFIFNDIQAAIDGKANYLAALGLVAYTEFMGGLISGNLGQQGQSRKRFYAFLDRLGSPYQEIRKQREFVKVYSNIRCGLAHAYFINQDSVVQMTIGDGHGNTCGIEVDVATEVVWFVVERYWQDFKKAVKTYHKALIQDQDPVLLSKFQEAVGQQWHFRKLAAATNT